MTNKPTLCLDFDGVIHSYTSGWKGPNIIADPPTEGAMRFIWDASQHFKLVVYSSRCTHFGATFAMKQWLCQHFRDYWAADRTTADDILAEIEWASKKPAAFLTIDDRAMLFTGVWPDPQELLKFKPWNKQEPKAKDALQQRIDDSIAAYNALSPQQKAVMDYEQRRSFVRGCCPSNRDYTEWCKMVDQILPPHE